MSTDRPARDYLVRTSELDGSEEMHLSHPLNDRSEIFMTRLSDPTGLSHLGISLARLPPGRESFALHRHTLQEEWIFVVSGEGAVQIDDEELPIRAGDFVGFPPNGPAHVVRNSSNADLLYLQGGDRRPGDTGWFPQLRRFAFQHGDAAMALVPEGAVELRPFTDWLAQNDG